MKLIQMNSLPKAALLLMLFSGLAGFPSVLAEEEHKAEAPKAEGHKTEDHKSSEPKAHGGESKSSNLKSSSYSRAAHQDLAEATGCLVDPAALEDLKRVKEELDDRKKDILSKEADLKAREQVIADELHSLEKIRDEIAHNNDQKTKDKEGRVAKLVETFLTMSPKSAAKVLSGLEDSLAVLAMSQMDTPHLAKIMNNMEPARSSQLSEQLAGIKKSKAQMTAKKGES
jgi:flagellar motility protein MotE (MotC chaperone)